MISAFCRAPATTVADGPSGRTLICVAAGLMTLLILATRGSLPG
jgi:hypothetical protein